MKKHLFTVGGVALVVTGCMSAQNHPALDALQGAASAQPVVEAFIEYPGPHEKWAGPASFLLHVVAKGQETAHVIATPGWFMEPATIVPPSMFAGRNLAAKAVEKKEPAPAASPAASPSPSPSPSPSVTPAAKAVASGPTFELKTEAARERLRYLASVIETAPEHKFKGCLSPVRVRLVRADGALLEKTGCRESKGWSFTVSEAVNYFMSAAVYGDVEIK